MTCRCKAKSSCIGSIFGTCMRSWEIELMRRGGGSKWRGLYHSMMTELFCIYEKRLYIMGLYLWLFGSLGFAFFWKDACIPLVFLLVRHWTVVDVGELSASEKGYTHEYGWVSLFEELGPTNSATTYMACVLFLEANSSHARMASMFWRRKQKCTGKMHRTKVRSEDFICALRSTR